MHSNSRTKFLNLNVPSKSSVVLHKFYLYLLDYSESLLSFYASTSFCPLGVALVASICVALSVMYVLKITKNIAEQFRTL